MYSLLPVNICLYSYIFYTLCSLKYVQDFSIFSFLAWPWHIQVPFVECMTKCMSYNQSLFNPQRIKIGKYYKHIYLHTYYIKKAIILFRSKCLCIKNNLILSCVHIRKQRASIGLKWRNVSLQAVSRWL